MAMRPYRTSERSMTPQDVAAMLEEDRKEWDALCAVLDAHPDGALHDPESPEWEARDVYAHLARWINHSTDAFESWFARRALPEKTLEGTDDEINARWQGEDSVLTLAEARDRAQAAFERRWRAIESVPAERWGEGDKILEATANADGAEHYRNHRRYVHV
jgi:hypothetical protein